MTADVDGLYDRLGPPISVDPGPDRAVRLATEQLLKRMLAYGLRHRTGFLALSFDQVRARAAEHGVAS